MSAHETDAALLAAAAARLLASSDGALLARWLRAITIERQLPADCAIAALRHLEGQRYLVRLLERLAARGRLPPSAPPAGALESL